MSFEHVTDAETRLANRHDWDTDADEYQAEHGAFLGGDDFVWSPEGWRESDVRLLGHDLAGLTVLEVGCGAGQCGRWLQGQGARVAGLDLSYRMLQHSARLDDEHDTVLPVVQADTVALPFAGGRADLVVSAFGALPFVGDIATAWSEIARVLRPGGRAVVSVTHPVRRMFPDDPTVHGCTITRSYFDRRSYVERDDDGTLLYAEPHHTLADWVAAVTGTGLRIDRLWEPEWPTGQDRPWGGWGPERGALLPGTLVISARRD